MKGFTLLEVLVSVALLAFISTTTGYSVKQAIVNKEKLQGEMDLLKKIHSALNLMKRDIEKSFHYKDIYTPIYKKQKISNTHRIPLDEFQEEEKEEKEITFFVGETSFLKFSSLNHPLISSDDGVSEQIAIHYFLSSCTNLKTKKSSSCLFRATTPYLEGVTREKTFENRSVILENIKSLEIKYLSKGEEWSDFWESDKKERRETSGFPRAVQIKITLNSSGKEIPEVTIGTVASVIFPNNENKKEKKVASSPNEVESHNPENILPNSPNQELPPRGEGAFPEERVLKEGEGDEEYF